MKAFKLDRAVGVLRPVEVRKVTSESTGTDGAIRKLYEVELDLQVGGKRGDVDGALDAAKEAIVPGAASLTKAYAGVEDDDKGAFTLKAHRKFPEMALDLYEPGAATPFLRASAQCKGKPVLTTDGDGDGVISWRARCKVPEAQTLAVLDMIGADVEISVASSQTDLVDFLPSDVISPPKKRGRGRSTDVADAAA